MKLGKEKIGHSRFRVFSCTLYAIPYPLSAIRSLNSTLSPIRYTLCSPPALLFLLPICQLQLTESKLRTVGSRGVGLAPVGNQDVQVIGRDSILLLPLWQMVKVGTNQRSTVKILRQFNTIAIICFCISLCPNAPAPRFPLRSVPWDKCECHQSSRRRNYLPQELFRHQYKVQRLNLNHPPY